MGIVDRVIARFRESFDQGFITPEMLTNYATMCDLSFHGRLQSILMHAGEDIGLMGVPEVRFRSQKSVRADVGFYRTGDLAAPCGLAEVVTIDMVHAAEAQKLKEKLLRLRPFSLHFVVIAVTLPKSLTSASGWDEFKGWARKSVTEKDETLRQVVDEWRHVASALKQDLGDFAAVIRLMENGDYELL
jgi:hypothetical protein